MRQRKPIVQRKNRTSEERKIQERAFFNLEGRKWIKQQINYLGRGHYLLKKMSVRTPKVKMKAFELTHNKDALSAAKSIINFTSKIPFVEVADITAANFYGKQTADDIISGKPIPTFRGERFGLLGCQTFCATAISLLRSATPKSGKITNIRVVRTISPRGKDKNGKIIGMPHTIISFKINGENFIADPFKSGYSFLGSSFVKQKGKTLVKSNNIKTIVEQLKKQGNWKEALDPADHGTISFDRYVEEARKHGGKVAKDLDLESFMHDIKYRH